MGRGALWVLALLCLFGIISVRNESDVTHCWVKGKEVTMNPLQCPAEYDGADAKLCCRICYGANCCQPRKARVDQSKCPHAARVARANPVRVTTSSTEETTTRKKREDLGFVVLALVLLIGAACSVGVISWFWPYKCCKRLCYSEEESTDDRVERWTFRGGIHTRIRERIDDNREEQVSSRVNSQSTSTPPTVLPRNIYPSLPPCCNTFENDPPPYSEVAGSQHLQPSYPGNPVVAFRRSSSQSQDDGVVILPLPADLPEADAAGGSPGGADPPKMAVCCGVPEGEDSPGTGPPGGAAYGGAPEAADLPEAAACGGAPELTE